MKVSIAEFRKYILVLSIFTLIAGVGLVVADHTFDVIAGSHNVGWHSDKEQFNGSTETHSFIARGGRIYSEFTLHHGDSNQYPFFMVILNPAPDKYFDLSSYDHIEVEVDLQTPEHLPQAIPIRLFTEVENYSYDRTTDTYRVMEQMINYDVRQRKYRLEMAKFETPQWWWMLNPKLTEEKAGAPDYTKVVTASVGSPEPIRADVKQSITLYRFIAGSDYWTIWLYSVAGISLVYAASYIPSIIKTGRPKVAITPKRIPLGNKHEEDLNRLLRYMEESYNDPGLTIEKVQKTLGISEVRIAGLLKSSLATTFKKHLNQIRLTEAKRLLRETDRSVNEIAYSVGYTNVTHFNRTFKEAEGCSPSQFRKDLNGLN